MTIDKFHPTTYLDVWHPRYRDKKALLSKLKVDASKNALLEIEFTKAKSMEGRWCIETKKAKKYKVENNGTIPCYVIPLEDLQKLDRSERSIYE